jgi:hypothetical protein
MKPRLRKMGDLWYCFTRWPTKWLGMGKSPREAFDDWEKLQ